VDVRAAVGLGEVADRAELLVVAAAVPGQQHPQRVVEVVGPDGVAAPTAALVGAHDLGVVHAGFSDHERARVDGVDAGVQRLDNVHGARVEDRVDGVEPQPVEVEVADPALGALEHPLADAAAVGVVEVDRGAPERLVRAREVGAERLERLDSGGADVVVHDVEQDREALVVGGVDEALQAERATVGGVGGRQVDAVVAPAVAAGELRHRQQLERGDAELAQAREVRDDGLERALGRERADVQLVDHRVLEVRRREAVVAPGEGLRVQHPRGAAEPGGLPAGGRVGDLDAIDHEGVVLPRRKGQSNFADAQARVGELMVAPAGAQRDPLRPRGPDAERGRVRGRTGAERALEGEDLHTGR
jgi:hypothetical protein